MKILILSKRQYMRKDLINDRFWKFRELPLALARRGHTVLGICLSYKPEKEGVFLDSCSTTGNSVKWYSVNLGFFKIVGLIKYLRLILKYAHEFQPDIVVGCSDSLYGIFGYGLSKIVSCKFIFEVYDNFDGFASAKIPGVLPLYHKVLRLADGVVCFSQSLRKLVQEKYSRQKHTTVIISGTDKKAFRPLEKESCRKDLQLPLSGKLIGMAGTLDTGKNVQILFESMEILTNNEQDLRLILAGRLGRNIHLPNNDKIIFLGELDHNLIPKFINALDVVIVSYSNSLLGMYSFPTRTLEAIVCEVPFVCANVGDFKEILKEHPPFLFQWDNAQDLAKAIKGHLENPKTFSMNIPSWDDYAEEFEKFMLTVVANKNSLKEVNA